jgi:hypothetical protein
MKITKYTIILATFFVSLVAPSALWADSTTYDISGTFSSCGNFFGFGCPVSVASESWLSIDDSTLLVTDASITFDDPTGQLTHFSGIPAYINTPNDQEWGDFQTGDFSFYLIKYSANVWNSMLYYTSTYTDYVGYGTLTLTPTPEPGALWLLGTGILGVLGLLRKR